MFLQVSVILFTGGGMPGPGEGAWSQGVSAPGGLSAQGRGAWWRAPGRLLLRAVRILLECILVQKTIHTCPCCTL